MQTYWSKKEKRKWGKEVAKQFNTIVLQQGSSLHNQSLKDTALCLADMFTQLKELLWNYDENKSHLGEEKKKNFFSPAPSHLKLPTIQTSLRLFTLLLGCVLWSTQCHSGRVPLYYGIFHPTAKVKKWPDMNGDLTKRDKEKGDQENLRKHIKERENTEVRHVKD